MPTFYDSKGQSHDLTEQIGRGGEGTVFACPNDKNLVAKIYHEPVTDEKAEKLRWMADNQNERLLKVAAWIIDTLHDKPDGEIVGFLMPNVKAKEIHELYSLKSRRVYFPDATWQFLVHTAANLARAFYNLHKSEHVMGDVNHGNCVVLADGTVKLIDCDSYSIKKENSRYPCEVGVATHLAPELQGKNLRDIERLEKHDNFGLAVIIFQLLFLGRHPFAGIYLGEEEKSLEDCIRELRFAYGSDAKIRMVKQPPGTLALAQISPRIALMLERAFLTEDRPEAQEWIEALEDLSNNLKQCAAHPGHHYFQQLADCPWCGIEAQTGLMLFPFVSGKRLPGDEGFNIFTVENLIANLNVPQNLPALPPKQTISAAPSLQAKNIQKEIRSRLTLIAGIQFIATFLFVLIFGGYIIFIPSVIIFAICLSLFHNFDKNHKIDLEVKMDTAQSEWNKLESEWTKAYSAAELNENLTEIRNKIDAYQNLPNQGRKRIKFLLDGVYEQRLNHYLSTFRIDENQIVGVGEKKLEVLKNFGVKTAADVDLNRLDSIPGTGKLTAQKLIEWKQNLERKFPPQTDIEISAAERNNIETEISGLRKRFEREINTMLMPLHSKSVQLRQRQQQLAAKSSETAEKLSQSKSDFESIALKIPAALTMGIIAVLMIFLGNFVHSSPKPAYNSDYPKYNTSGGYKKPPPVISSAPGGYGTGSGTGSGIGAPATAYSDDYNVPENLTDEQIAAMTDWEQRSAAKTLEKEATDLTYTKMDFKKAEKKLRLAVRLVKYDSALFDQLALVLLEQKKYDQSLKVLDESLNISPGNNPTRILIGKNYLESKKFREARDIFAEVNYESPSFETHYNLGLAHKGLNEDYAAISSFSKAVESYSQDANAQFELGLAQNKVGNKEAAHAQYEILLKLDTIKAENLKRIIGKK